MPIDKNGDLIIDDSELDNIPDPLPESEIINED